MGFLDIMHFALDEVKDHLTTVSGHLLGVINESEAITKEKNKYTKRQLIAMLEIHLPRIKKIKEEILNIIRKFSKIDDEKVQRKKEELSTHISPLNDCIEEIEQKIKNKEKLKNQQIIKTIEKNYEILKNIKIIINKLTKKI